MTEVGNANSEDPGRLGSGTTVSAHTLTSNSVGPVEAMRALGRFVFRRSLLVIVTVSGLIGGATQAGFLLLVGHVASDLAGTDANLAAVSSLSVPTAIWLSAGLLVILILSQVAGAYYSALLISEGAHRSRTNLTRRFVRSAWDLQSQERAGELQEVLTGHVNQIALGLSALGSGLIAVGSLVALLVGAAVISPIGALVIMAMSLPIVVALRPALKQVTLNARLRGRAQVEFGAAVSQAVTLSRDVTVFGVRDEFEEMMGEDISRVTKPLMKGQFYRILVPQLFQIAVFVLILGALIAVWQLEISDLEVLGVVLLLLFRAMTYGRQLQSAFVSFREAHPFIIEYREREAMLRDAALPSGSLELTTIDDFELKGIGYTYPFAPTAALVDVNMRVAPGEAIGIIGPSGSGKSTLLQILLRLRVASGHFRINGADVNDFDFDSWHRQIAYVPQKVHLLHGTVRDNISFLRGLPDEAVVDAARRAHLYDEILALPDGFDTVLGGLEGQLSGGQAQRLCIARALAAKPAVLFLDEPTSALDHESEARIQEVLADLVGKTTTFVITHRPATIQHCTRVISLSHGRVESDESR